MINFNFIFRTFLLVLFSFAVGFPVEIFSGRRIPRKKKFYKKDKQGYYYIPELIK